MTKSELIETIADKLHLSRTKAEQLLDGVFDSINENLKKGHRVEIRGFGSFQMRSYSGYSGRNPRNGAKVVVKSKKLPFFKVGKELKERVNASAKSLTKGSKKSAVRV